MRFLGRKYAIILILSVLFISINVLINIDQNETDLENLAIYSYSKIFHKIELNKLNPHGYSYILNTSNDLCTSNKITLIALVTSAAENFEKRSAIRATWANSELFPSMETVFITGLSKNDTINKKLANESQVFGDIVQEDFLDTYNNLTIKTVGAMKWVANYCNNTKFVLKVDDDMILNTYALVPFLENFDKPFNNTLLCLPNLHNKVDRNIESKFYISEKKYRDAYYPPYCNGGAYLLTPDLPVNLYINSLYKKLFVFEDVYVGMLAKNLKTNIISLKENYCWSQAHCFYALHRHVERTYFFFLNGSNAQTILNGWLEITEKMMDVIAGNPRPVPKFL